MKEIIAKRQCRALNEAQLSAIVAAVACDLITTASPLRGEGGDAAVPTVADGNAAISSLDSLGKTRLRARLKQMHGISVAFAVLVDVGTIVAAALLDARAANAGDAKGERDVRDLDVLPPLPAAVLADSFLAPHICFAPHDGEQWWRWGSRRKADNGTAAMLTCVPTCAQICVWTCV